MSVSLFRLGEDMDVSLSRIGEDINASASRIGNGLNVSCSVICSIGVDSGYYFLVQEGLFILSDGKKFELKHELSK